MAQILEQSPSSSTSSRDLNVTVGAIIFSDSRKDIVLPGGRDLTIAEVIDDPPESRAHDIVVISCDNVIPVEDWDTYKHDSKYPLRILVVPKDRDLLRTALTVAAVVAIAYVAGPSVLGLSGFTYFAFVVGANVAASYLINTVLPPLVPSLGSLGTPEGDPQRFTIAGTRNRYPRRRDTVPMIMGTHRMAPNFACQPYVYVVDGETQGYRALYDCGHGPLSFDVNSFKFGDTPVSSFTPTPTVVTHTGTPGTASVISQFNEIHDQRQIGRLLKKDDSWATYSFPVGTNRVTMILSFSGLVELDGKDKNSRTVEFEVQTRQGGSWSEGRMVTASADTLTAHFVNIPTDVSSARAGEIRIRRTTDDTTETTIRDQAYLATIDLISAGSPVTATGRALVYVDIQASENLNNTINEFSFEATRQVRRYVDGAFTGASSTGASNPAWQFLNILEGPGIYEPVPSARIDLDSLAEFAAHCDTNGYTFNAIWSDQKGVWERLNQVAAAGRGSVSFIDGSTYGVLIDRVKNTPVDLITPRDALKFSGAKAFARVPHGWRATFNDASNNYLEEEIVVYRDGFDASNATDIRAVDMVNLGATSVALVHRFLRYLMAVALLRPEMFSVRMDIKNLRLQRGDYVDVEYDAMHVGLGQGRLVKTRISGGTLQEFSLDEFVELRSGENHAVRFQDLDGTAKLIAVTKNPRTNIRAQTVSGTATGTFQ